MSSLKDKLYNYEQTPPQGAWDKIAAALDESHLSDQFPSTIYHAEVTPPAAAWDKIAGALDAGQAKVLPLPKKSFSFFRYAAAAVLIGIVALAVVKWTNRNESDPVEEVAAVDTIKTKPSSNSPSNVESITPVPPVTAITADDDAPSKNTVAKRSQTRYSISDNISDAEPIYAYNENTPNLSDRYFMLMTPEGGIIRMSKKWGSLVCCVSGQEQDDNCKDQIKKLQEKIACSPATTSPGNFMDILSLVSTLNETEL